jgi:hypothetical protein
MSSARDLCSAALRALAEELLACPVSLSADVATSFARAAGARLREATAGGFNPGDADTSLVLCAGLQVPMRFGVAVHWLWGARPPRGEEDFATLCSLVWLAREALPALKESPQANRLVARGLLACGAHALDARDFRARWRRAAGPSYFHNPEVRRLRLSPEAWEDLTFALRTAWLLARVAAPLEAALLCDKAPPLSFCAAAASAVMAAARFDAPGARELALDLAFRGLFLPGAQRDPGGLAPPGGCLPTARAVAATRPGRMFLSAAGALPEAGPEKWALNVQKEDCVKGF